MGSLVGIEVLYHLLDNNVISRVHVYEISEVIVDHRSQEPSAGYYYWNIESVMSPLAPWKLHIILNGN